MSPQVGGEPPRPEPEGPVAEGAVIVDEAPAPRRRVLLHVVLFGLTFAAATWAQLPLPAMPPAKALWVALHDPIRLGQGLSFAATLMTILVAHELGHYLVARRHRVDQSLPYFIPAPTLIGTLGAVIVMRSRPPTRGALLDVAVAGPYAGMVPALAACIWGLAHSDAAGALDIDPDQPLMLGSSLLFDWLRSAFGPRGSGAALHPVAFAGWVGLFVTSLNLIPAAQLDGGHIAYALFGRGQRRLSVAVILGLLGVGLMDVFDARAGAGWGSVVWVLWAAILFVVGLSHPRVRNESVPLRRGQRLSGWVALALFAITFVPVPLRLVDPEARLQPPPEETVVLPPLDPVRTPVRRVLDRDDGLPEPAEQFEL